MKQEMHLFDSTENSSPNIIKLCRALKTIPPMSIEAERAFSAAGLFVTKLRTRLSDKTPIMAKKEILEFVQSLQDMIDADSDDENEMNNATPFPTPSETRNIMKKVGKPIDENSACVEVGKPIDENPACVEVGTNSV
ncbi:hypothetical protein TNCV_2466561 [Trichonephila clavipes]|nr:hypothetical protein TNCV_2466561 [Trichonephila clavipes]